ncbi:hypothetical protein [Streptomyces sp. NPDC005780]|uniref:hypothetical protein n=1 Tax=Streptomyces sp. NPDC005780 TaxID=3364730 RepID=UPI0036A09C25
MKSVPEKTPTAPAHPDAAPRSEQAPSPSSPAPDRRALQRLQRVAGNAAVSRLVAQRYTAPVKPAPAQAPGFRSMKAAVAAKKTRIAVHPPAAAESKASQDAAVAPPDDKEAQGKAANAEKMNAAKPGEFDKKAFVDAVNKAIDAQAPKNLDEADKFSKSGKAEKVKAEVDGKVSDGKESSAKDIDTATKAPPDTSAAKDKPVTPLTPDQPPGNPGAPSAADAIPAEQPAAVTDFSEGPAQNDKELADAEVTEEQLAKGNEPEFNEALSAKKTAETDSEKAPAKGKSAENQQLTTAKAGAAASGAAAMTALTATRTQAGQKVDGGKGETKSKDEKKRAEVTAKLQKVYDGTKKDVETTLSDLDKKVDTAFTAGEKAARDAFTADHKRRMKKYKDKRYSGWTGKARWVKDKFAGLPDAANDLYQEARKLYVAQMQTVISSVADLIGTELGRAKARIAKGRTELKAEVDKLPADLRQFGEEAAKDFAGKFDDLEATVNEKSEQLVQDLASKYTAALNKIDEEIKKLQEANKGLIDKAKDAIVGAIKTINELKNLLLGILAKAAGAIMKIIKDPIGFLGNLVRAVGAGLNLFVTNIAEHLKTGVVSWLLGTAVKAGLELPQKFDMKGIIQLIGSLLGLTWDNIKARVTRKGVPDEAMAAVETSVPVAKSIASEGPAGAVKEIQAEAGDLKATILEKLTSYLIPTVIIAGITWILSLLNPASAFIRAVKGIIDIVTFVVTEGAQIAEFVNSVLDAVVAIANGGQAGVPKMVEAALAASVPLLIGFLASLLGIGSLANKVKQVFHAVARPVNRAVDRIIDFLAKSGRKIWKKIKSKTHAGNGSPQRMRDRLTKGLRAGVSAVNKYAGRPVASAILRPMLTAIRARYGLAELKPFTHQGKWNVHAQLTQENAATQAHTADPDEADKRRALEEWNKDATIYLLQRKAHSSILLAWLHRTRPRDGAIHPQLRWDPSTRKWAPAEEEPLIEEHKFKKRDREPHEATPKEKRNFRDLTEKRKKSIKEMIKKDDEHSKNKKDGIEQPPDLLEQRRKAHAEVTEYGEDLGERAAELAVQKYYPGAEPLSKKQGGSGRFDQIYRKKSGTHLLVEAKGPTAVLKTRKSVTGVGRVEQGTPGYIESILEVMTHRNGPLSHSTMQEKDLAIILSKEHIKKNLEYIRVQAIVTEKKDFGGYDTRTFEIYGAR